MRFSVIIPTHNRKALVLRALESVYRQTLSVGEIIVVDDGSTDGTIAAIQTHYPATTCFRIPQRGVSAARNMGIRAATGDWIALLDSDDEWHADKLAQQRACIEKYPHASLIHCDETWLRNGQHLNQKAYHEKTGGNLFERSLERCLISPSAAIIKASLFSDVGLFDENLPACEDYDLWLRICARMEVHFVPEKLVIKHGGHADQLSRTIWGLDRFRIQSLQKILGTDMLNETQRSQALSVLIKKLEIFIAGAKKRGHHGEVRKYSDMLSDIT